MNKNTIIALVIGLVIGGLAIWLFMFFAQGSSLGTAIGLNKGGSVTTKRYKMYATDQGNKSYEELKKAADIQKEEGGEDSGVSTCHGHCKVRMIGEDIACITVTCPSFCELIPDEWGVVGQCRCNSDPK